MFTFHFPLKTFHSFSLFPQNFRLILRQNFRWKCLFSKLPNNSSFWKVSKPTQPNKTLLWPNFCKWISFPKRWRRHLINIQALFQIPNEIRRKFSDPIARNINEKKMNVLVAMTQNRPARREKSSFGNYGALFVMKNQLRSEIHNLPSHPTRTFSAFLSCN